MPKPVSASTEQPALTLRQLAARALAELAHPRTARTCEVCGAAYQGISWQRYCSNRCRQVAKRQRQASAVANTPIVEQPAPSAE